ncbi:MAG TPA: hypothetical protein VGD30_16400 [Telluria sp.]
MKNKMDGSTPVFVAMRCAAGSTTARKARAILLILAAALGTQQVSAAEATGIAESVKAHPLAQANFEHERPSRDARQMADWIVQSGNSDGMPFVIVDKVDAKVFVFHADGRLNGATQALLGLARGDDSVPGIGSRKLSSILPEERTTPAGRYVAARGRNIQGGEIIWIDYKDAISLHPVVTSNAKERRAQRLATASPLDNRISYGCINVPAEFYRVIISPAFQNSSGVVYVLPETRPLHTVFPSFRPLARD